MSLKAGIVGLPNVGKSTLFNAITKKNILAANYPFATIEPNVGVVTVPDVRLDKLNEMYIPKKLVPTTFEFTDIAGLVKGASNGEGLGNKFLSHIREVDAVCEVVRCFENNDIIFVKEDIAFSVGFCIRLQGIQNVSASAASKAQETIFEEELST